MKDYSFGIIPYHQPSDRFLLIRHTKDHWSFPKGHAENKETEIETASRELFEETGLKASSINPRPFRESYSFIKKDIVYFKTVTYFLGTIENTEVNVCDNEVDDYIWLPYEQALEQITYEGAQQVLKQVHAYLNAHKDL
jgi:8-oxo-dGTP pyrophosphatase MutT (NUDIX family)